MEIDLRISRSDQRRYVRHALDGLQPGDVVKLMVDRDSDLTAIYQANLNGVHVQLTAESVHTMRVWRSVLAEVVR